MRGLAALGLLGLSCFATATQRRPRNHETRDYYVLHLDEATAPSQIESRLGLTHEGQLGELQDHHIFSDAKQEDDVVKRALNVRRQIRKRRLATFDSLDGIKLARKQYLKPRLEKRGVLPAVARAPSEPALAERQSEQATQDALARQLEVMQKLEISDPIFMEQWHLYNPVQLGHDVNVTDVWLQGITGNNSKVAIVDDGLDMYSDDLAGNYFAEGSYDFNDQSPEPKPKLSDDRHGTRCAGEVSAVRNNVCGIGVAYDSKIAGIRILSKLISDADEAEAMNYAYQQNEIYSCSWGPPDDGRSMDAPGILIKRAMLNAVQKGRGGKGSIYVFASGNGAASDDNCNFDGYTNSIYSITVGAVDRKGQHPYYSELCSAQLVVTYSSGSGDAIHTTDVGKDVCTAGHGGTSAAAPLAAGIFALVLSIRPDLSWRDMQSLVLQTAVPIDLDTGDWQTTTIGKKFSHTFGYGKIDTWATIEAAKSFVSLKPQAWFFSPWIHVNQPIPQGDQGLAVDFEVSAQMLKDANLERVEHVTVTMNIEHGRRGDLSVDLISPNKLVSHLSVTRRFDDDTRGYDDWTFMSVVHWGEPGIGTWTIIVKDTQVNEFSGNFTDWHLKLWGESIDPTKATLLPMPEESDDDNHDEISTTTIEGVLTTVTSIPVATSLDANPTDHPTRPVNAKPTETNGEEVTPTDTGAPSESESPSSWLPSFFPTFGVSARTQIWIYGALTLIVAFCSGLGIYFYMARRKRLRNNPRGEYEFDLIRDDEGEELTSGANGASKGRGKRRAGELYDAFAMGSEDEDEDFSDAEGSAANYRDRTADEDRHVIGDDEEEDEDGSVDNDDEKTAERTKLQR